MSNLSILHISRDFPPQGGGQGVYVSQIHKKYLEQGLDSNVVTSDCVNYVNEDIYTNVYDLGIKLGNPLFIIYSYLFFLFNKRLRSVQVIHGNGVDHFIFLLFKNSRYRYITTTHNTYVQRNESKKDIWKYRIFYKLMIPIERYVLNRSDAVICVSSRTRSYVDQLTDNPNISTIENGVDTKMFNRSNRQHSPFRFLFVGRLAERKRPLFTAQIFHKFFEKYGKSLNKELELLVVGDGEQKELLAKYVTEHNLQNVKVLGFRNHEEVAEIMGECHCFLLFSEGEGLPLTLLESVASGLAAITTVDASGGSRILQDGVNGYMVSAALDEEEILDKMRNVVESFDRFSQKSKEISREFDWDNVVKKNLNVYENRKAE